MSNKARLASWNIDFCETIDTATEGGKNQKSFIGKSYKGLLKYGVMPTTCPILPGKYYLKDLDLNIDAMYMLYMPPLDLQSTMDVINVKNKERRMAQLTFRLRLSPNN